MEILRVSAKSRSSAVAGAIAALLRSEGELEIQAMGPSAVNQAIKALAIARNYLEMDQVDLVTQPSFIRIDLEEERTGIRFMVSRYRKDGLG